MAEKANQPIKIKTGSCIACGICAQFYPDIFAFKNNKIQIINPDAILTKDIQELCPTGAIYSENNKKTNPKN